MQRSCAAILSRLKPAATRSRSPGRASTRLRLALAAAFAAGGLVGPWLVEAGPASLAQQRATPIQLAAVDAAPQAGPRLSRSALDAPLFYQLLIGEMEWQAGRAGPAMQIMLDAARRQGDEALYQRAVEMALQARAGEDALTAARAWAQARPQSLPVQRHLAQILIALDRPDDAAAPLAQWIQRTPAPQRPPLLLALPGLTQPLRDRMAALKLVRQVATPQIEAEATRSAARLAIARAEAMAGRHAEAAAAARAVLADDPGSAPAAMLALSLAPRVPAAMADVQRYLSRPDAGTDVRLALARQAIDAQRYAEAEQQLELITRREPQLPDPWLTLGALRLEQRDATAAETALKRYIELAEGPAVAPAPRKPASGTADAGDHPGDDGEEEADDDGPLQRADQRAASLAQAWLMRARAAEMRGDFRAAEQHLGRVTDPAESMRVATARAQLLARQGRLAEARQLIRAQPETTPADARSKLLAEVQLLRDGKRWAEASELLSQASAKQPDDTDLLYELAMLEEKRGRLDEMERLLRRVMQLKPQQPHAYNALGYSLADRGLRLDEAHALVTKALELSPGDPFITDSLAWVAFRQGRRAEALKLLEQAWAARADPEIAAHLGEVLWAEGRRDDARRIWREGQRRDPSNEALAETLKRLKVGTP